MKMNRTILLILSFIFLICCDKHKQIDGKLPDGVYIGTFQREPVWSDSDTANITMTFTSNQWSGSSDIVKYPALCHGTYLIVRDTIIFENECVWTADFAWNLILVGKYVLKETGNNTIEFSRDYSSATADAYVDKYKIIRQE